MTALPGLILCVSLTMISCHTSGNDQAETDPKQLVAGSNITGVACAFATDAQFNYFIPVNGKIKSFRERSFIAPSGVRLVQFNGVPGKTYTAGASIAQFDVVIFQHRLERGELEKYNSEKEYQSQLLGYENLLKGRTTEEAEAIRKKLRISTGLAQAEQDIKEAHYDMRLAMVKAPFSGVLANITVKEGQQINAGQEMFRLYDAMQLGLEVKVLESDIGLVKKGMPANISPLSEPNMQYPAHVEEINPYVDENGMITVVLKLVQKRNGPSFKQLFPGMNCSGSIHIPGKKSLLVPKDAVVMRNDRAVVFTIENNKAKWNYVSTGRENGREIEIMQGLTNGQKVIISNNLQLAHDAPVQDITNL